MTLPKIKITIPVHLILIFVLLSIGIGAAGYLFYESQKAHLIGEKKDELSAIADLKVNQVVSWRQERMLDGFLFVSAPLLSHIEHFIKSPERPYREELLDWLKGLKKQPSYVSASLVDTQGTVRLSTESDEVLGLFGRKLVAEASAKGEVMLSDFHIAATVKDIHLDLVVPLSAMKGGRPLPVGALFIRIDPNKFLYPLIQSWPTPSGTAETLLVRREGSDVLFLNELRHRKHTALTLRFPMTDKQLPAAIAVRGHEGIIEGIDYRGKPVLAALRGIPDSPWFLVAKVDAREVYAPIRERASFVALFVFVLIIASGSSVGFWWRQQRVIYYRNKYMAEEALRESKESYRALFDQDPLPGWIYDAETYQFLMVNHAALKHYGYTSEEFLSMTIKDIRPSEDIDRLETFSASIKDQPAVSGLWKHRKKDGTFIAVEINSHPVMFGGRKARRVIVHDVTERQRAEEALRESESSLQGILRSTADGILAVSREGKVLFANERFVEMWMIPQEVMDSKDDSTLLQYVLDQLIDPQSFIQKVQELYKSKEESFDTLYFKDGRVFERLSRPLMQGAELHGRVWSFRDITERQRAEEELVSLYQQIKEEADVSKSLLSMVEVLNTSLDEKELLRNVVSLAPRYLKFDRIGIFLYDEGTQSFTYSGGYGYSPVEEGIVLSRSFREGDFPAIDKAVRGDTVIIENALETDLISKELVDTFGIRSAVIIPISFRDKVIGGIYGDYKTLRPVQMKDVSFLKGLADGIAIALQNSRLYKESVERLMELSGKIETIKAMAHLDKEILSNIDRDNILRTATALINRVIPADRAAVALKEGDLYRIVSEWGTGEFTNRTYPMKGSHFESFEKSRASFFVADVAEESCPYHREQSALGIRSVLLIPLFTQSGVTGFLEVASRNLGRLTPAHLSTAENIASQISVALENARLYEELQQLLVNTISSLASAIDAKSPWTKGHSERVTQYALQIGTEMGLKEEELQRLNLSGLLHDVGKIGTYDILLDKPGKLTDEELELVKKHPVKGAEILAPIKQLSDVIPGILHHHERFDGRGYPDGLEGEKIPLYARILCVADSFDSMTADRPYRPFPGKEYAISEFRRCSGAQFDPRVVEAFLRVLGSEE